MFDSENYLKNSYFKCFNIVGCFFCNKFPEYSTNFIVRGGGVKILTSSGKISPIFLEFGNLHSEGNFLVIVSTFKNRGRGIKISLTNE